MKYLSQSFILLLLLTNCAPHIQNGKGPLLTSALAGVYSYGIDIEKERIGTIRIYPETDSTILFYIDLNRGAPSYNMGEDSGSIIIKNGEGVYYKEPEDSEKGCRWHFQFAKNTLTITTIDAEDNCGFGFNVYADGIYTRVSDKIPDTFKDEEGGKKYFKKKN